MLLLLLLLSLPSRACLIECLLAVWIERSRSGVESRQPDCWTMGVAGCRDACDSGFKSAVLAGCQAGWLADIQANRAPAQQQQADGATQEGREQRMRGESNAPAEARRRGHRQRQQRQRPPWWPQHRPVRPKACAAVGWHAARPGAGRPRRLDQRADAA
ncbi:hypothetical protein BC831DRAFT_118890 [Entophlyctis helioformis]|nr:hypothetical protein BC831DRAFT_118890 [Entophlyctis helioformis]